MYLAYTIMQGEALILVFILDFALPPCNNALLPCLILLLHTHIISARMDDILSLTKITQKVQNEGIGNGLY